MQQEARALQEEEEERLNLEAAWELQKQLDERQQVPTEANQSKGIDWNDPSVLRYHALKNKHVSIAQARMNMITYLKNQGRSEVEKDSSKPSERESSKIVEEEKVEEEDVNPELVLIEKKAVRIRRKTLARRRASDKTRHDLEVLTRLVKERYQDNTPEGYNRCYGVNLKIQGRIVGIMKLLQVNTAGSKINTASEDLMLLMKIEEICLTKVSAAHGLQRKYAKCLLLLVKVTTDSTKYGSRFCIHGGCIQSSMLKPGEFELWRMRIEQYIQMIYYALWEVIENGATLPKKQVVEGVTTVMLITSAEDKAH
ncbi:hypothetical protein Tco_0897161 [Tanacetum coccineum]